MASTFPNTLDSFPTNRTDGTPNPTNHKDDHNNANDAINKIEAAVGEVLIEERTTVGTDADKEFTNLPTHFKHLKIIHSGLRTNYTGASQDLIALRFNNDGGANYYSQEMYGRGKSGQTGQVPFATDLTYSALSGTADDTLQDCGATYNEAVIEANFKDLAAKINQIHYLIDWTSTARSYQNGVTGSGANNMRAAYIPSGHASNSSNRIGAGEILIPNFQSSAWKTMIGRGGLMNSIGDFGTYHNFAFWMNTAAITQLDIDPNNVAQFDAGGKIWLYGIH